MIPLDVPILVEVIAKWADDLPCVWRVYRAKLHDAIPALALLADIAPLRPGPTASAPRDRI